MNFLEKYFTYDDNTVTCGLTDELNIFYVLNFFRNHDKNIILLTSSIYEANKYYNLIQNYTEDALLFLMDDLVSIIASATSPELKLTRLNTIDKISTGKHIIICNLMAFLMYLPNVNSIKYNHVNIKKQLHINRNELIEKIVKFGYNRESITTSTGEYSLRGMILDIFLINEVHPIRIEFDDDIITSIRYFDENSQMSLNEIDEINIKPINEIITENPSSIYDYINDGYVINIDKMQIEAAYLKLQEEICNYSKDKIMFDYNDINILHELTLNKLPIKKTDINFNTSEIENFHNDLELLKNKVQELLKNNKEVYFCLSNDKEIKKIKEILPNAHIIKEKINKGFIIDDIIVISEFDIDNIKKEYKYQNNLYGGKKIVDYNELNKGDYVVHISHGIGIYNGITSLTSNGITKDYIQILYLGNDKIYVPVQKIDLIYKYSDKDGVTPKLNKLSSSNWLKTRKYVETKIKDISKELIRLYQKRLSIKSIPYKNYPEEDVFASEFEYDLTLDQKRAINDINNDLYQNHPMDRLLCGDVGFGKTEVALRTMFKAVLNNKQVMYLCPTTILSKQQYNVALRRFSNWPINIALLNRFTSSKEEKKIMEGIKKGSIDIIFGTHKLLNDKLSFNKLGLLIIDEEQRFGVKHKEKIKELKNDINVLTLSATPIPRTLKMALSGLRNLSIIETAPSNRYPVQTYVLSEDDLIIKDAIYKELSRGGQIFILYNNIEKLEEKKNHLKSLIPELRINYAHGGMDKNILENIMDDFIQKKYDVLLCTTIIENGIDIANANTLIVYDANNFGLSQLYQLRGRVGRSDKIGYAYFLYNKNKMLNDIAIKRLQAIKEFTALGSGYRIAMRDLSIRGSGDIFGASQAGFVDEVGVALYTKLMEDELKRQKGEEVPSDEEINELTLLNVDTHIEDNYVQDEDVKIEIHQMINQIDSYDKLLEVKNTIEDRFGKISDTMENYMYEEWFEKIAEKLNIKRVRQTDRLVEIELSKELSEKVKGDKLLYNAISISKNFNLAYKHNCIIITLYYKSLPEHFIKYIVRLLNKII